MPPALANRLLTWYAGRAVMEDLEGDLEELFYHDVERRSVTQARFRYWYRTLSLLFSYAVSRRKSLQAYHAYSYSSINPAMIKNYLLVAMRNLSRNALFISINVFGMAIATGCCIIAYLNYDFDAKFDSNHINAKNIYRVSSRSEFQGNQRHYGIAPLALATTVRQTVPEVSLATRYNFSSVSLKIGDDLFNEEVRYVDDAFFKLFSFEFIAGNAPSPDDKYKFFISDELALKLFNSTDVLGRTVLQVLDGDTLKPYEIAGVFRKQPMNSSFTDSGYLLYDNYFDEAAGINENDWRTPTIFFVKIDDKSRVSVVETALQPYVENNNKAREDFVIEKFVLDSFDGMAVRDERQDTRQRWTRAAISRASVNGSVIMAVLVMLIACFNLTNTTLAMSARRLKEIGIRKVMGSERKQLVFQFICETTFVCLTALVLGLWMTSSFLLPGFNSLWPYMKLELTFSGSGDLVKTLLWVFLGTILLAGAYPAFYVSRFEPSRILKGTIRFGGMTSLSLVFLSIQFIVSLVGIVCSMAFVQNARYQRGIDPGYNHAGVIFMQTHNGKESEALKNELSSNKDITSLALSRHHIGASSFRTSVKYEEKEIETDVLEVGEDYLTTAGITLINGRDFEKDSETDHDESVIITETFARVMGWNEPLGRRIVWQDSIPLYVVGVVKDVYTHGLWRKLEPLMFRYAGKERCAYVLINSPADRIDEVNAFAAQKWKELFPNRIYNGNYMDQFLLEAVLVNDNLVIMFVFIGTIAILLSGTGLFTLVSLNILKRVREIAIRKVMGASSARIASLVHSRFIVVMIISSLAGSWFSYMMVEALMRGIWAFYQPPGTFTLLGGIFLLAAISMLTVGSKIYEVVRMNPVNSLRSE